jgi:hypothetical protein
MRMKPPAIRRFIVVMNGQTPALLQDELIRKVEFWSQFLRLLGKMYLGSILELARKAQFPSKSGVPQSSPSCPPVVSARTLGFP